MHISFYHETGCQAPLEGPMLWRNIRYFYSHFDPRVRLKCSGILTGKAKGPEINSTRNSLGFNHCHYMESQVQQMHQRPGVVDPSNYTGRPTLFRPDYTAQIPGPALPAVTATHLRDVSFLVPDTQDHVNHVIATAVLEINSARLGNFLTIEDYQATVCCSYAAAISAAWPDLKEHLVVVLSALGNNLLDVRVPSQAAENMIEIASPPDQEKLIIWLAQLCLFPYKNLNAINYQNYMSRRLAAFKAAANHPGEANRLAVIEDVSKIELIKSTFGQAHAFRKGLLYKIMGSCDSTFAPVFSHTLNMLYFTDMAALTFINDTLITHKSPVLYDPEVQTEVINLTRAMVVVRSFAYPQFFRILGNQRYFSLLERGKFPILLAVAQTLKSRNNATVSQFVWTLQREHPTVQRLLALHDGAQRQALSEENRRAIAFLTSDSDGQRGEPIQS